MSTFPPIRHWKEFFDISKISMPHPSKLQDRVSTNLSYFGGNYLVFFISSFIFSCLINPFLLFAVVISIIGGFILRNLLETTVTRGGGLGISQGLNKDKKQQLNPDKKRNIAHMFARWYIYGVFFFLMLMGNIPLFVILSFFVGGMLTHAAIRDKSLKGKSIYLMDLFLDLNLISRFTRLVEGGIYTSGGNTTHFTNQPTDMKNPIDEKRWTQDH